MQRQDLSLKDFENAVDNTVDNLYIMYKENGGNQTYQTVKVLLRNIHRISPWLEDMMQAILDKDPENVKLLRVAQPIVDAMKESSNGAK